MDITIQQAIPHQATELSHIAFQAKSYWGYSAEQLEGWREEFLTFSPDDIENNEVWVAVNPNKQIVGFARMINHEGNTILDDLWVLPDFIGKGIGRQLFQYVATQHPEFTFTSDPNADAFYRKMGAEPIGETYSVLQDKMLTIFKYTSKSG